jgi:hypothetical protein
VGVELELEFWRREPRARGRDVELEVEACLDILPKTRATGLILPAVVSGVDAEVGACSQSIGGKRSWRALAS